MCLVDSILPFKFSYYLFRIIFYIIFPISFLWLLYNSIVISFPLYNFGVQCIFPNSSEIYIVTYISEEMSVELKHKSPHLFNSMLTRVRS